MTRTNALRIGYTLAFLFFVMLGLAIARHINPSESTAVANGQSPAATPQAEAAHSASTGNAPNTAEPGIATEAAPPAKPSDSDEVASHINSTAEGNPQVGAAGSANNGWNGTTNTSSTDTIPKGNGTINNNTSSLPQTPAQDTPATNSPVEDNTTANPAANAQEKQQQ